MKRIICIFLMILFCLSLAACGESEKAADATADATVATAATEEETAAATAAPTDATEQQTSSKAFDTVDDYLASPEASAALEQLETAYKDNAFLSVEVYADGDAVVYEYQYKTDMTDDQIAQLKTSLPEQLKSFESVFKNDAKQRKDNVNAADPRVVLVYLAKDDTEIYREEYRPD